MREIMKSETRSISRSRFKDETEPKGTLASTPRAGIYSRPYWSATNPRRRIRSVTFDIQEEEDANKALRRMSAPELPPILDISVGNSPSSNQGLLTGRYIKNKKTIHYNSDSSYKGSGVKTPQSPESSGSSQSQNQKPNFYIGHRTANGYINRSKTWVVTDQTSMASDNNSIKLESIVQRKNGFNLVNTPRSNDYSNRFSSRFSTSSGNNNSNYTKKKLTHCASDSKLQKNSKITPVDQFSRSKTFIKRVSSDHQLLKENRTLSVEKTNVLTKNKRFNTGNVNGMRRYSSTLALTQRNSAYSDENYQNDEDSDSESDKGKYIMNWLIGVETEDAEAPPEPEIEYEDEPPQTDTAVHVVYEES